MSTLSVVVHYRRTVVSDCYVNVPITNALMTKRPDGSFGLDTERLFAEGATYCGSLLRRPSTFCVNEYG
ncbi:MAG: hypothetical protein FWD63_04995 [Propionibacteriaceae bacterium]|nr:hypothetical protein [Propionibacteriaceae bacterium]